MTITKQQIAKFINTNCVKASCFMCKTADKHTIREQKTTSTTIEEKVTTTNKETRILMASGQIQEYCWFREKPVPGSQYEAAINSLTSYLLAGGNEHDDVPDGLSMLVDLVRPSKPETTIVILGGNNDSENSSEHTPFYKRLVGRFSDRWSDMWI